MKYNLRLPISCLLGLLAAGPFIYYFIQPIAELRVHYRAELLASVLTLPILLMLSFNPRFARFCARDPAFVHATSTTARYVSFIVFVVLVLSMVGEFAL